MSRIAFVLLLLMPVIASAQPAGWFPFVMPYDDASASILHVGHLNSRPAGANGFLRALNGHLVDGTGQRVRLLGVNFTFSGNFPEKKDAVQIAARLRKFGVNIARFHHMDSYPAPQGIWDRKSSLRRNLDREQLDRLDYFIARLKDNGIYTNLNLHVSRSFTREEGFEEQTGLPDHAKCLLYFDPKRIALQHQYARELLDRVNPYTKTHYRDEPALAVVELVNENSLLAQAWHGSLHRLAPGYHQELSRQWNAWLAQRYRSTAALRTAWKIRSAADSPELLRNGALHDGTKDWVLEQHQGAKATLTGGGDAPTGVAGRSLRIEVLAAGSADWHVQLTQSALDLQEGEVYTVRFHARADKPRDIRVATSLDRSDWRSIGLNEQMRLEADWKPYEFSFTASQVQQGHSRLQFVLGNKLGRIELAGLSLRAGAADVLVGERCLEEGRVPLGKPSHPGFEDWLRFLMDIEAKFVRDYQKLLKQDLKMRALVVCSQANWGGLGGVARESLADLTDTHAYWEHPRFPRRDWDPGDWHIPNTPMIRDSNAGPLSTLACVRLSGRPLTVSEYNHPAPNDYQAECVPLLAALACWQDWDGIYYFDYGNEHDKPGADRIRNYFSIDSNPTKMALLPAAALLFRRGDLSPAPSSVDLQVPREQLPSLMRRHNNNLWHIWNAAGSNIIKDVHSSRLSITLTDAGSLTAVRQLAPPSNALRWEGRGTNEALFQVDSPRSKLLIGYLGGRKLQVGSWDVEVPLDGPNFAVLALSSPENQPIEAARSLLVTAVGRAENTGMRWNADRTSVGRNWGTGPVLVQGIEANLAVPIRARSAAVYALDVTGKRAGKVASEIRDGKVRFRIGAAHRTLWYEIAVEGE
jgi:hypothetical protein